MSLPQHNSLKKYDFVKAVTIWMETQCCLCAINTHVVEWTVGEDRGRLQRFMLCLTMNFLRLADRTQKALYEDLIFVSRLIENAANWGSIGKT